MTWLKGIDSAGRKQFIDSLFSMFDFAGLSTLEEYRENRLASALAVLKGFSALPEEHRKQFKAVLRKLFLSGMKVLTDPENEASIGARIRTAIEENHERNRRIQ